MKRVMEGRCQERGSSPVSGAGRGRLRFSLLCSLLFLLGSALCSEEVKKPLPKPDRENRRVFSFSASLSDAQEVQLLRSRYGRGLYVETAVSIPLGIVMNWGAEEGEGGLEAFQRSVDNLFSQAKAQGVGLHLYFLTGASRALSGLRGAKVEDLRNCQWFNDNLLLAPSAWQREKSLDETVFATLSRYARKLRNHQEVKLRRAFRYLARKVRENPEPSFWLSGPGELELSFLRIEDAKTCQTFFADYSPFAVLEFRDWILHQGLYDDKRGPYAGQGWAEGGLSFQGKRGLERFNQRFQTNFTSWRLRFGDWSLEDPWKRGDPHALAWDLSRPGIGMGEGGSVAGGFDPPRTMKKKGEDPFTDLWQLFREEMVTHYVADVVRWANEEGFPPERLFTHQIPTDYLFGTSPLFENGNAQNARFYSSASPLRSAVVPGAGVGVTCYDIHFPNVHARTSDHLFPALEKLNKKRALMEFNPEVLPRGMGVPMASVETILQPMRRAESVGISFYDFFLWKGDSEWAFKGNARQEALDLFFREVRQRPLGVGEASFLPPPVTLLRSSLSGEGVELSWSGRIWPDLPHLWSDWEEFGEFVLYRSENPDFLPSRENLLGTSGESRYVDKTAEPGKRYFYRVAARTKRKWRGEDASLEVHVPR